MGAALTSTDVEEEQNVNECIAPHDVLNGSHLSARA